MPCMVDTMPLHLFDIYFVHQRLSGFPTWSPRLHKRIALHAPSSKRALVFDRLPRSPREPLTLVKLLLMYETDSVLRQRNVRWPLKYAGTTLLVRNHPVYLSSVHQFNQSFEQTPFHLFRNNCDDYANCLAQFLLTSAKNSPSNLPFS